MHGYNVLLFFLLEKTTVFLALKIILLISPHLLEVPPPPTPSPRSPGPPPAAAPAPPSRMSTPPRSSGWLFALRSGDGGAGKWKRRCAWRGRHFPSEDLAVLLSGTHCSFPCFSQLQDKSNLDCELSLLRLRSGQLRTCFPFSSAGWVNCRSIKLISICLVSL